MDQGKQKIHHYTYVFIHIYIFRICSTILTWLVHCRYTLYNLEDIFDILYNPIDNQEV